jgi:type IV secretory pathway protease TraF
VTVLVMTIAREEMFTKLLKYFPTKTILCTFLLLLVMSSYTLNVSDSSTPGGLYRMNPVTTVAPGDLLQLRMPIKRAWAMPGAHVTFTEHGVYCEGPGCYAQGLIPNSRPQPGLPRAFPDGSYTVPPFMFLGMGTNNPDSWDSRYVGFLPLSLVKGKVTPVWTR